MKEEFENKTNPNEQGKKISMSLFFLTISVLIIIALMWGGIAVGNKNTEIVQLQAKCATMQDKVNNYDALVNEFYDVKAQLERSNDTIAMLRKECKNGKSSGSLLDALLFGAMLGGL